MVYPAMTYIGSNKFSALYGQNDTIIDQKATGLQHLYVDNYEKDLLHTACTSVLLEDTLYYADRVKGKVGHPKRQKSSKSYVEDSCVMVDEFEYRDFSKVDRVSAHEQYIRFQTKITNTSKETKTFQVASLLITKPENQAKVSKKDDVLIYEIEGKVLFVKASASTGYYLSLDAPSGFMYKGIENILHQKSPKTKELSSTLPIASSIYTSVDIRPNETYTFDWVIYLSNSLEEQEEDANSFVFIKDYKDCITYWNDYLSVIEKTPMFEKETRTKLVALKGALLDGLLPADLTGHYFANGQVCFYSRDALMGSRAFLYAGLYEDFLSIIQFLLSCKRKDNGEFYQRYRFDKVEDEGANNNVFAQIDFIGYFTRVVTDYYHLKGQMCCSFEEIDGIISILENTKQKHGLYGPEGGVNEGVYGPAFITSTNMFIAGGLKGAIYLAKAMGRSDFEEKWSRLYKKLFLAIEQVYKEPYYPYGYVTYHEDVILRYDTPQMLAGSLGYPLTSKYRRSFETMVKDASYFGYGIGYSEQEYHDGPWIFNTAATAQVAYLLEEEGIYQNIMNWLINHQNGFLMHPEAIDAKNEQNSFINPLMWANSEFVVASYAFVLRELRKKS